MYGGYIAVYQDNSYLWIELDGILWMTVTHYYLAQKFHGNVHLQNMVPLLRLNLQVRHDSSRILKTRYVQFCRIGTASRTWIRRTPSGNKLTQSNRFLPILDA